MKRLKGPELKMPDVGVPSFLADVYYDLRDRRLLPVVALVAVAIAAVPFLLGGSEEPQPVQTPEEAAEAARLEIEDGSSLNVVEAKPGLRDYRKRLRGRTPTDPFIQRYAGLPEGAELTSEAVISTTDVAGGSVDEAAGESGDPVSSPPSAAPAPGSGHGKGATGTKPGKAGNDQPDDLDGKQLFGFRPDVRFGVAGSGELKLHDDLPLGSLLPEKNAVVLFVGVAQSGERALFSVAPEVLVRGSGGCVGGDENCRFLSMREGDAVDLVTGVPGRSYRLKVESIDFVELDLPPKSERASGSSAPGSRRGLAPGFPQNFSN